MKAILQLVVVVIQFTPIGMLSLVAYNLGKISNGSYIALLEGIGMYVVTQTVGQLCHMLIFYPLFGYCMTCHAKGEGPEGVSYKNPIGGWKFFARVFQAPLTAFATSSSAATMPVTLAVCKDKDRGNLSAQAADFTVPLGAAINMDGTGLGFPVMIIFTAQAYGLELSVGSMLMVAIIAVVCSIGTAPIPNAGIVYITMLMAATNDPLLANEEVIGVAMTLIIIMDWFVDRVETAQNVWSDCNVTRIIHIWESNDNNPPPCFRCIPGCKNEKFLADIFDDQDVEKQAATQEAVEHSVPTIVQ